MTAEHLETLGNKFGTDRLVTQAIGATAIPKQPERTGLSTAISLTKVPDDSYEVGESSRKISMAATLIKERFQSLIGNSTADERDVHRAKLREDSVRVLFQSLGMVPNSDAVNEQFSMLYREVEANIDTTDRSLLVDLADTHATHPAVRVFDTVRNISSVPEKDVVTMKCASLLLIDQHTLA